MARLAIAFLFALASSVLAEQWHDTNGQLLANGKVASADAQSVVIQLTGKSTATIHFDDLSMADSASVRLRDKADSEFREPFRQWASANGTFHAKAKAVAFVDDKTVRLTRDDDKVVSVPIDKLSKTDQSYLDRLKSAVKPENVAAEDVFSSADSFNGSSTAATDTPSTTTTARKKSTVLKPNADSGAIDRNPNGETQTGATATGIPTGPRGGQYHYSASGNKV